MEPKNTDIVFTPAQVAWLEKVFPEELHAGDALAMARAVGIRTVVAAIRRAARVEARFVHVQR